jgi:hypothetical protein
MTTTAKLWLIVHWSRYRVKDRQEELRCARDVRILLSPQAVLRAKILTGPSGITMRVDYGRAQQTRACNKRDLK